MDDEKWKNINYLKFSHLYDCSTYGRIRRTKTGKIIKSSVRNGYPCITLSNGNKITISVHRIIALTFLDNPNNYPVVNHKNGNRTDNNVSNLEWCSYKENTSHALNTKIYKPSTKKVSKYSYDNILIETFDSIKKAEEKTGVGNRLISQVCRGQKPTAHGYIWKYVDGFEKIERSEVKGEIIPEFPNYIITEQGKVYSIRSKRYLVLNTSGDYNYVKLCNNNKHLDFFIHVLVARFFVNNTNNYKIVNHLNANKRDNRKENLEWTTSSGNMKHHIKIRQKSDM